MNEENTRRIIDSCPSLFSTMEDEQRKLQQEIVFSPIAFGFECGDGWADLLVDLCKKIQAHLKTLPEDVADSIVALQVKEKFGTLRFYLSSYDETIESYIEETTKKSACTCEQCGKPGKVQGSFWYYTACEEHTLERDRNPLTESDV